MTNNVPPSQPVSLTVDQALQQAIAHHQAGQLQDAERLYRVILQDQPNHPDANHNLGVLAVQVKQPAAALPHFKLALEANQNQGQYWLSYIDALMQTGQTEAARPLLEQGRQRGLQGEAIDELAKRLAAHTRVAEQSNVECQHTFKESLPVSPEAPSPQSNKKKSKTKTSRQDKSLSESATKQGKTPSPQEINSLVSLFTDGRYTDVVTLAQTMTARYPLHAFGWNALGVAYSQMGRSADALAPMKKAAELSPGDAMAHSNLCNVLHDLGRLNEAEAPGVRLVVASKI